MADLSEEEYDKCLREVHEVFRKHSHMRPSDTVQKGKGPRNSGERAQLDEQFTHEKECYNGVDGGRVFKYYTLGVFTRFLRVMGVEDWRQCTERQCMDALSATSEELRRYVQKCCALQAHA